MKIQFLALALAASLFGFGHAAHAEEANKATSDDAVKAMTGSDKKPSRKKKAQICGECGKPESECECHGHKDGEVSKDKKDEHKH